MELQISPATGMVRPARMEGNTWKKVSRATKKEKIMTCILKFRKKGPFNIHLKVKRPGTSLG
jgi:hypothetical protein